jgi:hypothetical protein
MDEEPTSRGDSRWSRTIDLRDVLAGTGAVVLVAGAALIHIGAAVMLAGAGGIALAVYLARR